MSLSALLLGTSSSKDEDLDLLFKSSASAPLSTQNQTRTHKVQTEEGPLKKKHKKHKVDNVAIHRAHEKEEAQAVEEADDLRTSTSTRSTPKAEKSKRAHEEDGAAFRPKKKRKSTRPEEPIPEAPAKAAESNHDDTDGAITTHKEAEKHKYKKAESPSNAKTKKKRASTGLQEATHQSFPKIQKIEAEESDNDSEGDPSELVHESLLQGAQKSKKAKYAPEGETSEQRNTRTLFVGNLPIAVAKEKPAAKAFKRHILSFIPSTSHIKIESMRFRSVPFQAPTSKLSSDPPTKEKGTERQHELDRASFWKTSHSAEDEDNSDKKKFLTPAQKKKIAFIKGDLHNEADSVNAYVVLVYPPPPSSPSELAEKEDVYEMAKVLAREANGSLFMEHSLRVSVAASSSSATGVDGDPKKSVFVGSLDFAAKEDDLRMFFETLLSSELGQGEEGGEKETYVERVRIIRDKDTQLGKGFGYVQFTDRKYVDETLAMDESKLRFAKRKMRVQRCKVLPSSSSAATSTLTKGALIPVPTTSAPISIPKGDPTLGSKLVNLSKEERKHAKALNADRIARRLAKKKARNALQVPAKVEKKRERKLVSFKKDPSGKTEGKSKGRARSDRSVARRNVKK